MVDALAHARDVLRMIAIGIQQHHIQARDVEFLYADGPKRVSVHRLAVEAMQGLEREIAARPAGVPVAHPTDGERDLAALCVRLVRRLREVSPDDKLGATATDYLNQRRYLNPLRIKAMGPAPAPGVPEVPRG